LEYTPQELYGVLFYTNQTEDSKFQADWERTRIQTYYLVNLQLAKKDKIDYNKFKNDVWPFYWETRTQTSTPQFTMNLDDWEALLKKPIISQTDIRDGNL